MHLHNYISVIRADGIVMCIYRVFYVCCAHIWQLSNFFDFCACSAVYIIAHGWLVVRLGCGGMAGGCNLFWKIVLLLTVFCATAMCKLPKKL